MEENTPASAGMVIPDETLKRWQSIVDIIAELIGIPAALIMRLVETDIEVFVASQSRDNPYHPGDHEHFLGSGLYCETVITTNEKLLIPNALEDPEWKDNPDIKLNMISYLGFPIVLPDGQPFGTICVLDNKENPYSATYEDLIRNFRDIISSHLELVYMNQVLGEENKTLSDYLKEIKVLRGIVPICSHCKNICDNQGGWQGIEAYIENHSDMDFSHSICPKCAGKFYPDYGLYDGE